MTDEHPRLWHFCYPCDERAYPGRYQCAYLGGVACAVCVVDVPPVTLDDAAKAARERWGWPDHSTVTYGCGFVDGEARWKREGRPGSVTLMGYDNNIGLYASAGCESAAWTLSGEVRAGCPMRPLVSALDDCEQFLRDRGCPVPQPEDEEFDE